ncbi:12994_t:CDS:1, partial [Cetraspora pellucida]
MIGFINPTLAHIKQDLYDEGCQFYNTPNLVNLENLEMVFDNEIEYEDVEEREISKHHRININVPQNCDNLGRKVQAALYKALEAYWNSPANDYLLPTLLDPRHKKLEFADSLDRKFVMDTLKNMYNKYTQDSQQTPLTNLTDIVEPYNLDNELSTKSLKKKFCSLSQNNE